MQEPEAIEGTTLDVAGDAPPGPTALEGSEPSSLEVVATEPAAERKIDEPPEPDKDALQKRFDKLTKARREAEREAAYQRGRAEALEATKKEPEPVVAATPKPVQDDFESYDDYVDALTDWKVEQKLAQFDKRIEQRAETDRASASQTAFEEKLAKGSERYEDFEEVAMGSSVPITQGMVEIMRGREDPVGIAYYLGKHIQEATRISRLTPLEAACAIGKIEAEVAAAEKAKPPPKPVTNAPPPIKPVSGGEVAGEDPENMSYEKYKAWRASGGGK